MPKWSIASFVVILSTVQALQPLDATSGVSGRRDALHWILSTATGLITTVAVAPVPSSHADSSSSVGGGGSIVIPGGVAPYQPQGIGSWKDLPLLGTKLAKSRILAPELSPLQQAFWGDKELYYAPFLFGAWKVRAELKRKIYPYGVTYLPSTSLLEGSPRNREELVGNVCHYEVHYFSTDRNPAGGKILQDRGYNAISLSKAYEQLVSVQDVTWDYRSNPEKVVLDFGATPLAADMRPLGPRRAEVFLTARQTEGSPYGQAFAAAERSRSVTIAGRDVVVADTETITEFERLSDDTVRAVSRIAVYLSPNPNSKEGVLWQQTGGKAVAFFDYKLDMNRIRENESLACVGTPEGETQCIPQS